MSTVKADTIQSTSGGAATLTKQHAAKAWCHLNATTFAILDSFNNSAATDDGTGLATFNLTSAMNNDDFAYAVSRNGSTNTSNRFNVEQTAQTTSSISISTKFGNTSGFALGDAGSVCSVLHGDLA